MAKGSKERKRVPLGIAAVVWIIFLTAVIAVFISFNSDDDGKKVAVSGENLADKNAKNAEEDPEPVIAIDALTIHKEYKDNEVAADLKYKDKQLEITGVVEDIGKDILGDIYVNLDTGEPLAGVRVTVAKNQEESIAALEKGQTVTFVGKGDGLTILSVGLKDSALK